MAIEMGSNMQGISDQWGHGPPACPATPRRSPGESTQALEDLMDEIMRSDDEDVAPQSIAEDVAPQPSGLEILGALPDAPPRPTPRGPLAQHYMLMGPPPNRPFLFVKKLRDEVKKADAAARAAGEAPVNVPHADPIFTEQQLDIWLQDPIFSIPTWGPPHLPWLCLMPSDDLKEWKHTRQMSGHVWPETIEPLCREGPYGYMQATRILHECLLRGNADHVPPMSLEALEHLRLEKEFGNLAPEPWRPAIPASPVSDAPTLEMAPQDPQEPEEEPEVGPQEERSPEFPSETPAKRHRATCERPDM